MAEKSDMDAVLQARVSSLREAILAQPAPLPEDLDAALLDRAARAIHDADCPAFPLGTHDHGATYEECVTRYRAPAAGVVAALGLSAHRSYLHGGSSVVLLHGRLEDS